MKRFLIALVLLCTMASPVLAASVKVEGVTSPGGIKAWLVRDDKLPLVAMRFAFRGGVEQDTVEKMGLAELATSLLTEGAGDYDAEAFQQQLADKSIQLSVSAGRDTISGSVKSLREFKDTAFDLLRLALTQPRFDTEAFERARGQQLTQMRFELGDPGWQARRTLFAYIFAGHPYSMRHFGTMQTLQGLTPADAKDFVAKHLARDNLIVGVTGDISPEELGAALDQIFGALPAHAQETAMDEVKWPEKTAAILVNRAGTQSQLLFALPAPRRKDDDWYAAEVANYILGGGGFSSRLMQDVRDKAGLTYGISTGMAPMDYASVLLGQAAAENGKAGQAWNIVLKTWRNFYDKGVTDAEIKSAKDYLTGSLPLQLTSTGAIAATLVSMQLYDLGMDYLDERDRLIRQVSADDIEKVIHRWFDPAKLDLTVVGQPTGIVSTETHELTRE